MKEVRLTEPVRVFLQNLVPRDAKIEGVRMGAYELEISYLTAGGVHARHEVVTWRAVSTQEID